MTRIDYQTLLDNPMRNDSQKPRQYHQLNVAIGKSGVYCGPILGL